MSKERIAVYVGIFFVGAMVYLSSETLGLVLLAVALFAYSFEWGLRR